MDEAPPSESTHPAWMEVDLEALAHNYTQVRRIVGPDTKIIASVKGNGYGVGVVEACRTLKRLGVYAVATGSFKDAMAIRQAGIDVRVQMFPGNLPDGVEDYLRNDLIPSVYNLETAQQVSRCATVPTPVYVKVDAGLARLGVPIGEADALIGEIVRLNNIVIGGVFTHLPFSNADGLAWARQRLAEFDRLIARLAENGVHPEVTQSVASAGIVAGVSTSCNTVCTGHLLFGGLGRVTPDLGDLSPFQPVLHAIRARLIHLQLHARESAVGMDGNLSLPAGSKTGVIPIGLYDGYRNSSPRRRAHALIQGKRVPVLYVTQEYTTLDLTGIEDPRIGDVVSLLGGDGAESISTEEMAAWFDSTPLNILMSFNARFPCQYIGDNA